MLAAEEYILGTNASACHRSHWAGLEDLALDDRCVRTSHMEASKSGSCDATNTNGSLTVRLEQFPAAFGLDEGISSSYFFRNSTALCRGPPVWSKNCPWT